MSTLQIRLDALASAIGTDIKGLRNLIGVLASLNTSNKTNLVSAINEVNSKFGDVATSVGELGNITVAQALLKLSNELDALEQAVAENANIADQLQALINDAALADNTTQVFSASKVYSLLTALETKILGGMAPEAFDTIKELADYLTGEGIVNGIVSQLSKKVDVSLAQNFNAGEQLQARTNIGASSKSEFDALSAQLGDVTADLVTVYNTAKA